MNIAVLTSNQPRHACFLEKVCKKIIPKLIVIEEKEKSTFYEAEEAFFKSSRGKNPLDTSCVVTVEKGRINSEKIKDMILSYDIDLCFIFGTSLLKERIINASKHGCINIHTGLVQGYRGVDSSLWAIYNYEPEMVGVTVHHVTKGIDDGHVIIQSRTELSELDTVESIFFKTCMLGFDTLCDNIEKIINFDYESTKVSKGKLYQNKNMTEDVKNVVEQSISSILSYYLKDKKVIDTEKNKLHGDFKWKL